MPRIDPRIVPRMMAGVESIRSFLVGISPVIFCCTRWRSISAPASRLRMISANPNTPIATVAKPRPSASSGTLNAMREAPVSMSDPTIDSNNPNTIIAIAFSTDPFASTVAKIKPSTISEKYSAGPNASASLVKGAPSTAISTVETQPAKNDPIAAIASAGPARFRHLETIERRHHRCRLARNIDQDRGGRAAILRAVVNAGEHDQRADRRQAEGNRQQHGDGGDGADARQHADQRTDERADQTQQKIDRRKCDAKAEREIMEKFNHRTLTAPGNAGTAASATPAHTGRASCSRSS